MAGQPKKRAMIAELARRALDELGDANAHLEYAVDWVKGGKTMIELASDISEHLLLTIEIGDEKIRDPEINARMITKYLNTKWPDTAGKALADARREGAHGLVAEAMQIADDVPADREKIAKAKLRVDTRLWAAERWNRDELGKAPDVAVQLALNINTLHLDAMRVKHIAGRETAEQFARTRAFLVTSEVSTIDSTIDVPSCNAKALICPDLEQLSIGL